MRPKKESHMKKLFVLAALVLGFAHAQAAPIDGDREVGAETIIRQVLNKKLLKGEYRRQQNVMLRAIFDGTQGTPFESVRITNMECEGALGSVLCSIHILEKGVDGYESLSDLNVKIHKGEVRTATMTVIAG